MQTLKYPLFVLALAVVLGWFSGCSVEPKEKKLTGDTPVAPADCEGLKIGDMREETCVGGKKVFVCLESGLKEKVNTCQGSSGVCTSFADVNNSIISPKCASCHVELRAYDSARQWASKVVARVTLPVDDRLRMPQAPAQPLSSAEQTLLKNWVDGGAKESCTGGSNNNGQTFNLDYVEVQMVAAIRSIPDEATRKRTRFIVNTHKLNEGASSQELQTYAAGASKTLNSVNVRSAVLRKPAQVDDKNSIQMIDINDFGITTDKWDLIIRNDKLKIVSNTDLGRLLRDLTGTSVPWLHADNMIDITQRNPDVYYGLTDTPQSIGALQSKIGVNFAADLRAADALFVGGNSSPISLLKNRLIIRLDGNEGYYWQTFDPIDINGVRERNLFEFPLLKDTGAAKIFSFNASEVIYRLPNGMQGYALFNDQGVRQNAAPLNIVADNRSPITPEIKNAISCHRCHSAGIINMDDQIRDHVLANAAQFPIKDVEFIRQLYKDKTEARRVFSEDQTEFANALQKIGVNVVEDPVNQISDKFLQDWTVQRTAAFVLRSVDDFKGCINQSATGKSQIGQLLTGGVITYNQFVEVLPVLIRDCRLFEEPFAG